LEQHTAAGRSRFLDLRALAGIAHMRFTTRHRIEGVYSGRHQSRQQGGASEFVDFREYAAGEDLRRLDWKVLARTGRAYVRCYQDETNLRCTLVIDASGSMRFNGKRGRDTTGSKLEYAQYLATAMSHIVARQRDQVGLAVATDQLHDYLPPGSTQGHIKRVQETIENLDTHHATRMGDALQDLFQRSTRRGVLMIMSDFLDEDLEAAFAAIRLFRHRHNEVIVLHVIHPHEERLPKGVAYRFEGLENEGRVDASPFEIREQYHKRFAAHVAMVRKMSLSSGCDYRRVSTAIPYMQTLGGFLVERAG
jgi:uncharacterized protein (DUF58 family)